MPPASAGVGTPPDEIRLHPTEKHLVIEQFVESAQLRLKLEVELGDQLEEVYGIVSIDYHGGWLRSCVLTWA